ncbi:electron transfer flavoprotein beta subunit lysine methyltransferase-like [Adelges cooleyi]|uniref:electron transfer flavoprotein beta subunit lysine methyltransferase-like n=1 Tax=Adelges cooleyi TaxID=133065 RepID=UPI00217F750B|nr:electron transfer flavoprotein beta subunit lysine methyltransferase-like [Adelges cooleyi]XP_050423036.1 electron transfer flavoprotein beta subunit lysine methyltransferase-like [Adelges cooleyi]
MSAQLKKTVHLLLLQKLNYNQLRYCTAKEKDYARKIKESTVVCSNHLTPEIKLHLITEQCKLWYSTSDECEFEDPFWAFYWPGGQVISRFLLDNQNQVNKKKVLDIGSGSAACSIAAAMAGANTVTANDIDLVACVAATLNAQLNNVKLEISSDNFLFSEGLQYDVIIIGDMFYSKELADVLWKWLFKLCDKGQTILIGDPGRHCFQPDQNLQKRLIKLKEYNLTENCCLENRGFSTASVWTIN